MARKRVTSQERRTLILEAARRVFSKNGFDAAKTLEIAQEANVSEALVYRHFPSKRLLYRAVLRQAIREQDENFATLEISDLTTAGIIRSLKIYFTLALAAPQNRMQQGYRLMLASIAGNGSFANLIYRRSQRIMGKAIEQALQNARAAGDLQGIGLISNDTSMFIEHIGTMLCSIVSLDLPHSPYKSRGEDLARQATWFCCRGIGLSDEAITRHIDE